MVLPLLPLQDHTGVVTAGAEQGQKSWGGAGGAGI